MEVIQNGRNVPKIVKKNTFLTPGGQNIEPRNKSYEKKKFYHVLKCHVQLFCLSRIGPKAHRGGPKAHHLPKNGKKSTFFTPGGQNMQPRNKSHEIKKFHHVLKGHVQHFCLGRRPIVVGRTATIDKIKKF